MLNPNGYFPFIMQSTSRHPNHAKATLLPMASSSMASRDFPTEEYLDDLLWGGVAEIYIEYGLGNPRKPKRINKPVLIAAILKKVEEMKANENRDGDGTEEGGEEEGPVEAQDGREPDDTSDPPEGRPVPNQQSMGAVATVSQGTNGGSSSEDQIDGTER